MQRKSWQDLSPMQRASVISSAVVQLALMAAAQWDIAHRRDDEINGKKNLWRAVVLIGYLGPISYFLFGRKRQAL